MGVSVKGKIAIMRYHTEFRGSKVQQATKHGAIGAILYSDPKECAMDGTTTEHVYPSTVWMPPEGVQRGSLMIADGDVLTPLYPSRADLYGARTIQEAKNVGLMPTIPVLPLSYSDAYQLLSRLDGQDVPAEWAGGLNITYKTGPGFTGDKTTKARVTVHASTQIKEIRNVIGYIYGQEEPDDGTATLAEVARAFTQTIKESDWRPARTLVFCAWDAEEYGLIGSTEFVEDFANILSDRAIVYLNVDLISANSTLNADTIPSMYQAVVDASKKIPNPMKTERDAGRKTVYDTWIQKDSIANTLLA
uniref:Uncharacterized protein n=1 Tax=Ditylenchus dipsaci TaxID=166011 RepID=A0A915CMS7_9BILA